MENKKGKNIYTKVRSPEKNTTSTKIKTMVKENTLNGPDSITLKVNTITTTQKLTQKNNN